MDDFEKRVLKQKKQTVAENVDINEELLSGMKRANLINEDMLQVIKSEKHVTSKASLLLDYVMATPMTSGFDTFTNQLMTDYSWLAKEIQADVKAERGSLEIDDDVLKEAGMLVHRKFGTSKRLGETDKKDIQELIAIKIQISKEEWKEEIGILKKEIKHLEDIINRETKKAKDSDRCLRRFIKDNEKKLVSRAHSMKSTSEILRSSVDDDDILAIIQSRIDMLTSRCKVVIEERDLLFDEREECYKAIGARDDSIPLHRLLKNKAEQFPDELQKHKDEASEKDRVIKRLRKLLGEYETELDEHEGRVSGIKEELSQQHEKNDELKREIELLKEENSVLRAKLETKPKKATRKGAASAKTKANGHGDM